MADLGVRRRSVRAGRREQKATGKNNDRRIRKDPQRPVIRLSVGKRGEKGECGISAQGNGSSTPVPKILKKRGQKNSRAAVHGEVDGVSSSVFPFIVLYLH